jgi:hypothetical protein
VKPIGGVVRRIGLEVNFIENDALHRTAHLAELVDHIIQRGSGGHSCPCHADTPSVCEPRRLASVITVAGGESIMTVLTGLLAFANGPAELHRTGSDETAVRFPCCGNAGLILPIQHAHGRPSPNERLIEQRAITDDGGTVNSVPRSKSARHLGTTNGASRPRTLATIRGQKWVTK